MCWYSARVSELISIRSKYAPTEKYGEFLVKTAAHHVGESVYSADTLLALHDASHADLLSWARERFGIEA